MALKQQLKELGDYALARFESPLGSVESYMFNINTTLRMPNYVLYVPNLGLMAMILPAWSWRVL